MNVKISSAKTMTYAGKINNNNEYSKIPVKPVKVKGNKEKTPSKVMSGNETKITKPILDGYIYEKDGITYRAKKIRDSYEWETPLDLTAWYTCLEVVKIPDKASVKIPDKLKIGEKKYPVSFIGKKAAYGNKNLKKIVFSNHIVMVDKYAFANCENLETVVTGQNTKTVYEYGFYNCKSLKSITFQTGYVDLYKKAFYNCKSLKKVIFTYETKSNVKANKKYWDKNKVFTKTKAKFIIKDQKK